MKLKRLSPSMRAALGNLDANRNIAAHVNGQSQHGGFVWTCLILRRCGLTDTAGSVITEAGRAALASGKYDAEVNVYAKRP